MSEFRIDSYWISTVRLSGIHLSIVDITLLPAILDFELVGKTIWWQTTSFDFSLHFHSGSESQKNRHKKRASLRRSGVGNHRGFGEGTGGSPRKRQGRVQFGAIPLFPHNQQDDPQFPRFDLEGKLERENMKCKVGHPKQFCWTYNPMKVMSNKKVHDSS